MYRIGVVMMTEKPHSQDEMIMRTINQLVPMDHILRKIDAEIDFQFIYPLVKDKYSSRGRSSVDPVVLIKIVTIQYLFGIKSMRQTIKECEVNIAYRWFLGLNFSDDIPHFSTFGKNYSRRFKGTDVFEQIFQNILNQAIEAGLVGGEEFFTDSTHIKANANKRKFENKVIEVAETTNKNILDEINEARATIAKKPLVQRTLTKSTTKNIKVSTTDPESGYYHRDHKEQGFMYLDHRTTDGKLNIILDAHVTPGNVHDSKPFVARAKYITEKTGIKPTCFALDAGYLTKDIIEYFETEEIFGVIGHRRFPRNKDIKHKYYFKYQFDKDVYVCPSNKILPLTTVRGNGYKVYCNKTACQNCENKTGCISRGKKYREITRHIKEDLIDSNTQRRLSEKGKELYSRRKQTVELSFADSKQNHGYRYALYRGIDKVQDHSWMLCAVQNMKKIAIWKPIVTKCG